MFFYSCGDGVIFKKTAGFVTTGKTALSPYFKAFRLIDSENIRFECTYTTCASACDDVSVEI